MNKLIKDTVLRPRPYNHLAVDTGFSFPSGHSNASTLLYFALMIIIISVAAKTITKVLSALVMGILW
ncbi:phosphatase PAP2 family protein, partial [Klebsiella aerogenes]